MRTTSLAGKLTQLSNLSFGKWPAFIQAWLQRHTTGTVPCVFPYSRDFVRVPLQEFYDTYWFFCESRHGCAELGCFARRLRPGDVVYDIGAFRGAYGAAAKSVLGNNVQVHLFEPLPNNLRRIAEISKLNKFEGFTIVDRAVGVGTAISGTVDLQDGMLRQGNSVPVEFRSTSVDVYVAENQNPPTVVKIDVEGFEFDLFEGARHTLRTYHPRLWVELHPDFLTAQGKRWEDLIELIKTAGYKVEFFDDFKLPTKNVAFHIWCEQ